MAKRNYENHAAERFSEGMKKLENSKINQPAVKDTEEMTVTSQKKKAGRPSKGEMKKISLSVPVELYQNIEIAAVRHKGNVTAYINFCVEKDIKENLEKYKQINDMLDFKD